MSLKNVGIGEKAPEVVNVVIEIPRGQLKNKYEVDKDTGAVFLDRVNNVAFGYPYDYVMCHKLCVMTAIRWTP